MIRESLQERALHYHQNLPGLVRATLIDHGISNEAIDRHDIGFDGEHVVIPVRLADGRIAFFERWLGEAIGIPVEEDPRVEIFGADSLREEPERVIVAEGIHEALVLESRGFPAVAASGSGRYFKVREWRGLLANLDEVALAFRRGERLDRRLYKLSRLDVVERVREVLPQAVVVAWPEEVGVDGGAVEYFLGCQRTREDFERLLELARTRI